MSLRSRSARKSASNDLYTFLEFDDPAESDILFIRRAQVHALMLDQTEQVAWYREQGLDLQRRAVNETCPGTHQPRGPKVTIRALESLAILIEAYI